MHVKCSQYVHVRPFCKLTASPLRCDAGRSLTFITAPPEATVLLKLVAIDSLDILALIEARLARQDMLGIRAHYVAHKRRQGIQIHALCLVRLYCIACLLVELIPRCDMHIHGTHAVRA